MTTTDNPRVAELEQQLERAREKRAEAQSRLAQVDAQIAALEDAIAAEQAAAGEPPESEDGA